MEHLAELRRREATYWWHVNKRLIVTRLLNDATPAPCSILEIGCGGGLLSSTLAQEGWEVLVGDLQPQAINYARRASKVRGVRFDANDPWPLGDHRFGALLMLDVLEHLQDDSAVLGEIKRVLQPGGVAIITVPAHAFLFSKWDELLGHKRRHGRRRFRTIVESAGLDILRLSFWNLIALPPALVLRGRDRLIGSRRKHADFPRVSDWVNLCLTQWGRLEWSMLRRFDLPMGLSLVAVLQKRKTRHFTPARCGHSSEFGTPREIVGELVTPPRRVAFGVAQKLAGFCLRAMCLEGIAARNTTDYHVTRQETRFPDLPRGFDGFRILHLSDLHIDGIVDGGRKLFRLIESLEYDLCVMTGDYSFGCKGERQTVIELMQQLLLRVQCQHGVIGILGDHDSLEMAPRFEDMGMRVLLNESTSLSRRADRIWLAGVDARSPAVCHLQKAMSEVSEAAYTILLVHSPDCIADAASQGVDFCLAGHTHGGQLCLPFGIPVVKNSKCPWKYASGAWTCASMRGFTSRGVGTSGLRARLFCPPEVVIHELRVAEPQSSEETDRATEIERRAVAAVHESRERERECAMTLPDSCE